MDYVSSRTMNVLAIRLPSESMFSFELSVYSVFGIPLTVSPAGLAMDVDRQYSLVKALDGNADKPKQFFLSSGANGSAIEHSVPEQLWSTTDNPAYGISAVKAIKLANDQGIPIYTINQSNIDTILPQLQIDADAKTDIRNAVNAGKEVTVSKTNITYNGWTGCGYIIIDLETGEGAYMISGGMNGGEIEPAKDEKVFWDAMTTTFTLIGFKQAINNLFAKGSSFMKWIGFKLGVLGILLDLIMDLKNISDNDKLSSEQKRWSIVAVTFTAMLSTLSIWPLIMNPVGILIGFIYISVVLVIINFIEELALETIRESGV